MKIITTTSSKISAGDNYGRYTVLGVVKLDDRRSKYAYVQCSCGSQPKYVRADIIRNGGSQSCGCLQKERVTTHGESRNPLRPVWAHMISRCSNANDSRYSRYGARGISVCARWLVLANFISDMSGGYEKGLQIDRIDNNGNYEPLNCKWSSRKEQAQNKSRTLFIEFNGKTLCASDWAKEIGVSQSCLWRRLKILKWSKEDALTTPSLSKAESATRAAKKRLA